MLDGVRNLYLSEEGMLVGVRNLYACVRDPSKVSIHNCGMVIAVVIVDILRLCLYRHINQTISTSIWVLFIMTLTATTTMIIIIIFICTFFILCKLWQKKKTYVVFIE